MRSLALLPCLFSWLLILANLFLLNRRKSWRLSKRDIFLATCVLWGSVLVVWIEGLSVLKLLTRIGMLSAWIVTTLLLAAGLLVQANLRADVRSFWEWLRSLFPIKARPETALIFLLLLAQLGTLALVAYLYPPNNYDSMTYHMPRVMHWIQNRSVADYATSILRQIALQPFAEYQILNLQILSGTDIYSNLVQWFSLVMCIVGVSRVTEQLGGNQVQQWIAAILCSFLPMAILQSTTTQNDLVAAAYCLIFALLGLNFLHQPDLPILLISTGLSLGLALFTKGTAYIYMLPFCVYIGAALLVKRGLKNGVQAGLVITALALLVNAGFFLRNLDAFRNPLGPSDRYTNASFGINVFFSNAIRNAALNFLPEINQPPWLSSVNATVLSELRLLHEFTGLEPDDPRTTWGTTNVFSITAHPYNEDFSGNEAFILLMFLAIGVFIWDCLTKKVTRPIVVWGLLLFLGAVLYSTVFRWQVWGSRLQLIQATLGVGFVVVLLFRWKRPWLNGSIAIFLAFCSINFIYSNVNHPVDQTARYAESRKQNYFNQSPNLYQVYTAVTQKIADSRCTKVGLIFGEDTYEYPIWMLLRDQGFYGRIEHVQVQNESAKYALKNFSPCAVISEQIRPDLSAQFSGVKIDRLYLYLKN